MSKTESLARWRGVRENPDDRVGGTYRCAFGLRVVFDPSGGLTYYSEVRNFGLKVTSRGHVPTTRVNPCDDMPPRRLGGAL